MTGSDPRILIISKFGGPPPAAGNRTRLAAFCRELSQMGYEVHFAGIRMTDAEKATTRQITDHFVWNFAYKDDWSFSAKLWSYFKQRAGRFIPWVHLVEDKLDQEFCGHWLEEARELQRRQRYARVLVPYVVFSKFLEAFPDPCVKIIETQDIYTRRRRRLLAAGINASGRALMPYSLTYEDERRGLLRANRVIAIQDREATFFQKMLEDRAKVFTIGHLGDLSATPPTPAKILRIGCVGGASIINAHGLKWFLRKVWPSIRDRVPEVEFCVAGGQSADLAPQPGLRLLGQVSSLEDFYRDCPVLINPVRAGTGLKIKTIEALMHGRPIVTTSIGGEGLEAFCGQGLFVCDGAQDFASAVVKLLQDLPLAQHLGEAALQCSRRYLEQNRQTLADLLAV
jgi:glycosyltransferase involved in cell wall biosynthesis